MTLPNNYVLTPSTNTVFLTSQNLVLGFSADIVQGVYRFLKDHYINNEYIPAGTVRQMLFPWLPTADVEPMDATAAANFYAQGPRLGACIRTQFAAAMIGGPPKTYWLASGNTWTLTGLGAGMAPIVATVPVIEDKST